MGQDMDYSFWTEASRDVEAEDTFRRFTSAKVAASSLWPFLAQAKDSDEFEMRLDLAMDRLAALAQGDDLTLLVEALRSDYEAFSRDFNSGQRIAHSLSVTAEGLMPSGVEDEAAAESASTPQGGLDRMAQPSDTLHLASDGNPFDMSPAGAPMGQDEEGGDDKKKSGGGIGGVGGITKLLPELAEAAPLLLAMLKVTTSAGVESFVIVDEESGYKIAGPFKSQSDASAALASGKFKGRKVKIEKRGDGKDKKKDTTTNKRRDESGGSNPYREKGGDKQRKQGGFGQPELGGGWGGPAADHTEHCSECGSGGGYGRPGANCPDCEESHDAMGMCPSCIHPSQRSDWEHEHMRSIGARTASGMGMPSTPDSGNEMAGQPSPGGGMASEMGGGTGGVPMSTKPRQMPSGGSGGGMPGGADQMDGTGMGNVEEGGKDNRASGGSNQMNMPAASAALFIRMSAYIQENNPQLSAEEAYSLAVAASNEFGMAPPVADGPFTHLIKTLPKKLLSPAQTDNGQNIQHPDQDRPLTQGEQFKNKYFPQQPPGGPTPMTPTPSASEGLPPFARGYP